MHHQFNLAVVLWRMPAYLSLLFPNFTFFIPEEDK